MPAHLHLAVQEFNVLQLRTLSSYLSLPSSQMFSDLLVIKKPQFEDNDRIVFYLTDNINDVQVNNLLVALQKNLTLLDIPNFFVLIVTNLAGINNTLETIRQQHSIEDSPISSRFVDCPVTEFTNSITSLVNPPDSICIYPWIGVDVSQSGNYRPCCFYSEDLKDDHGNFYNAKEHTINDVYLSTAMKSLREEFRQGNKPEQCKRCWIEEEAGDRSKRQLAKTKLPSGPFYTNWEEDCVNNLRIVSIGLGITCNIKCRICSSDNSSSIANEILLYTKDKKNHPAYRILAESNWVNKKDLTLWDSVLEQSHLENLDFSGGEPMLSKKHFELLETLIAQDRAKNISIHYNTNGTILPDKAPDIWDKFKLVHMDLSIDNIGDRFEFERAGGKWSTVLENLSRYHALRSNKFRIGLHLTVNIQNAYYLPEICDWVQTNKFDDIHFNLLSEPDYLALTHITPIGKDLILEKLSNYNCNNQQLHDYIQIVINFLKSAVTSNGEEFCRRMKILDTRRNESFLDLYPEIAKAMGYV